MHLNNASGRTQSGEEQPFAGELDAPAHTHTKACWWHIDEATWLCPATSQATSWPSEQNERVDQVAGPNGSARR